MSETVPPQPARPCPWLINHLWMANRACVPLVRVRPMGFFSTAYARRYRLGPGQHSSRHGVSEPVLGLGPAFLRRHCRQVTAPEGSGVSVAALFKRPVHLSVAPTPRLVLHQRGGALSPRHCVRLQLASVLAAFARNGPHPNALDGLLASVQAAGSAGNVRLRLHSLRA